MNIPRAERVLADFLSERRFFGAAVVHCATLGRAQCAAAVARAAETATVTCLFLDLFARSESDQLADCELPNLRLLCDTDFPEIAADAIAIPVSSRGEAELSRDLLQQAHLRLRHGGRLFTATDNPGDTWLHGEMRALFSKVTRTASRFGVVYSAAKTAALKKAKNFECRFAFRDGERLIHAVSRPGVFSHRRLDAGARALLETMQIRDGERVFEIGCGCGALSVASALRADGVRAHAVDSNPRAVQCTRLTAEANGVATLSVALNADAAADEPGAYDVAITNPPYYSRGRLWELFVRGAVRALKPSGRLYVVSKREQWYLERLQRDFAKTSCLNSRSYKVVVGEGLRRVH